MQVRNHPNTAEYNWKRQGWWKRRYTSYPWFSVTLSANLRNVVICETEKGDPEVEAPCFKESKFSQNSSCMKSSEEDCPGDLAVNLNRMTLLSQPKAIQLERAALERSLRAPGDGSQYERKCWDGRRSRDRPLSHTSIKRSVGWSPANFQFS